MGLGRTGLGVQAMLVYLVDLCIWMNIGTFAFIIVDEKDGARHHTRPCR
jgi:hypothetical protein